VLPHDPPVCAETLEAVATADWVFLGPGSWYTSVLPHLLVPRLRDALVTTPARLVLNLNLDVTAETRGFRTSDHLTSLLHHAPGLQVDVVLADPHSLDDADDVQSSARALGAQVVVAPVAAAGRPGVHDSLRLAAAYRDLIG
jgi:uncharacterized cofD-like protein